MKIIFLGTPEFAKIQLQALLTSRHQVTAVITQPDAPAGRSKKLTPPPVKLLAGQYNIPVYQPEKIRNTDFIEFLKPLSADIYAVAAYGQILPESLLAIPPKGCINVHGSLLPKLRGAAPIQWAIINGETETGVTIMQVVKALDAGNMLLKKTFSISDDDTYETVHDKMAQIGASALLEALDLIEKNQANPIPQNPTQATYAPMITKETGRIDWNKTARQIFCLVRGLYPYPAAFFELNGEKIKVFAAEILKNSAENLNGAENSSDAEPPNCTEPLNNTEPRRWRCPQRPAACNDVRDRQNRDAEECVPYGSNGVFAYPDPGTVIAANPTDGLIIKAADDLVRINELQSPGGKRMSAADYLRGHKLT